MGWLIIPALVFGTLGIQLLLRSIERRWCDYIISILMFIPPVYVAWSLTESHWQMFNGPCTMDRIDRVYLYTREGAIENLVFIGIFYIPTILLWHLAQRAPLPYKCLRRRKTAGSSLRWLGTTAVIVAILVTASFYIAQYQTLEDAVSSNDVDLARRRLQFNWEGLGPDNGYVIYISSGERHLGPLLPIAIWKDNAEMVDLLLDHGAEINTEKLQVFVEGNLNPLDDAMRFNNAKMVDHLLERGVVPTEAIRRAARNNDVVMVERMLSAGANPTPAVYSAVDGKHRKMLELLLNAGADPSPGIIPAYRDNNTELLAYLYTRGADPTRALQFAEFLDKRTLEYLLARGADPTAGLKPAIRLKKPDLLERLIKPEDNPNDFVEYAIEQSSAGCLELLLRRDADPNLGVEMAVRREYGESLSLLLKNGADHNLVRQAFRNHQPRRALFLFPIERTLDYLSSQ